MSNEAPITSVTRKLIELSASRPAVHSFNRQFCGLLLDATGARAATMWLLRGEELVRSEEIESTVGTVRGIQLSDQQQQLALRGAFEEGHVLALENRSDDAGAQQDAELARHRVCFAPIVRSVGNFGVVRLVFGPMSNEALALGVQLAEAIGGYYSLYAAQRALEVQHRERQDIDRLSKAILQLQHYTFSRSLPEVIVNSALEVAPQLDRVVLLAADRGGDLEIAHVSSVSQMSKKSAWAKLVVDLGKIVLQRGEGVQFIQGATDPAQIEEPELREHVNSYVLMTDAKSVLVFPLRYGEDKVGVVYFETFEQPLSPFETVLCTIFAAHVGSALANHMEFRRLPLGRLFARGLDRGDDRPKRGRLGLGTPAKVVLGLLIGVAAVYFVAFHKVPDTVGAQCFVEPMALRVLTPRLPGEVRAVNFSHGARVEEGDVLVELDSELIELEIRRTEENMAGLRVQVSRMRGDAEKEKVADRRGSLLAQVGVLQHELQATEHQLDILRQQLADCTLRAPIGGTVIGPERPEELVGVVVRAGEPLCEIGQLEGKVRIRIAVPEMDAPEVAEGQAVEVRLQPLLTEQVIEGTIARVNRRSVNYKNANVFMANVVVDNRRLGSPQEGDAPGERMMLLMPGMTGKAQIAKPEDSTYLMIYGTRLHRKLAYWFF